MELCSDRAVLFSIIGSGDASVLDSTALVACYKMTTVTANKGWKSKLSNGNKGLLVPDVSRL